MKVFGIEEYETPDVVEYLQLAFSFVVTLKVADVVPAGSVPVGWPSLLTGGIVSVLVTVIVADLETDPPVPVQVSVYIEVVVGVTDWVPEAPLDPLHAPEAVHEVVLVDDHERIDDEPGVIVVGEAVKVIVGVEPLLAQVTPLSSTVMPKTPV